jgi:hypothetical protein
MAERTLNDSEAAFAKKVSEFFGAISELQSAAATVIAQGGDPREAFLSLFDGQERAMMATQWPMVSMLLGAG